jgi:hypothetical protein
MYPMGRVNSTSAIDQNVPALLVREKQQKRVAGESTGRGVRKQRVRGF